MTLDQYLKSEGSPSVADFAKRVGISEVSLWRIRKGEQNITRDTIRSIIEASGGEITADSLVAAA